MINKSLQSFGLYVQNEIHYRKTLLTLSHYISSAPCDHEHATDQRWNGRLQCYALWTHTIISEH